MALNKYFFKQRDHPHEQLELMLKTNVLAPEDGQPQMIVLDSGLSMLTVRNELLRNINNEV